MINISQIHHSHNLIQSPSSRVSSSSPDLDGSICLFLATYSVIGPRMRTQEFFIIHNFVARTRNFTVSILYHYHSTRPLSPDTLLTVLPTRFSLAHGLNVHFMLLTHVVVLEREPTNLQ